MYLFPRELPGCRDSDCWITKLLKKTKDGGKKTKTKQKGATDYKERVWSDRITGPPALPMAGCRVIKMLSPKPASFSKIFPSARRLIPLEAQHLRTIRKNIRLTALRANKHPPPSPSLSPPSQTPRHKQARDRATDLLGISRL